MYKIFYLLLTLLTLIFPSQVLGDTGLTISPATLEILIQPDQKLVQNIIVTNHGEATTYNIDLYKLIPIGNHGGSTLDLTHKLDPNTLPTQITLNNQAPFNLKFVLEPGINNLTLGLNTPLSDQSSELYLILAFTPTSTTGDKILASPTIGLPILLTISDSGEFDYQLQIIDFQLPKIHNSTTPFNLAPKLQNTSAHMLRTTGELQISSPYSSANYPISSELILKDTERSIVLTQDNTTTSGLTLAPSLKRFGPHTFSLTLKTMSGKTILTSSQTVWFLPLNLIIASLTLALLALALIIRRKYKKNT